jgi:hypothetical protein
MGFFTEKSISLFMWCLYKTSKDRMEYLRLLRAHSVNCSYFLFFHLNYARGAWDVCLSSPLL